jgi:hypothetical protein
MPLLTLAWPRGAASHSGEQVVANCMSQLAGLYTDSGKTCSYRQTFKGVHLPYVLTQLGEVLRVLVTLDEIVGSNSELQV